MKNKHTHQFKKRKRSIQGRHWTERAMTCDALVITRNLSCRESSYKMYTCVLLLSAMTVGHARQRHHTSPSLFTASAGSLRTLHGALGVVRYGNITANENTELVTNGKPPKDLWSESSVSPPGEGGFAGRECLRHNPGKSFAGFDR